MMRIEHRAGVLDSGYTGRREGPRMAQQKRIDLILGARDKASPTLGRVSGSVKKWAAGIAAVGAAAYTAKAFVDGWARSLQQVGETVAGFENEITPLLSLGDNVQNIDAIRQNVLGLSEAWGITRDQVSRAMFDLQSGTANLDQATREKLLRSAFELHKVYGVELPLALQSTVKTFQIYGDAANDVSAIQRKLAFLGEEGFLTFQDMAQQLPDVASAADAMGASLDEVLASLVVATQRGGKTEKTFTGVRNVFLRLNNAQREGIFLTGSFTERLRQLNEQADAETLKKIFGDEALASANNLLSAVDQIDKTLAGLGDRLPDIAGKMATRFEDVNYQLAEMQKTLGQLRDNDLLGVSENMKRSAVSLDASRVGARQKLPPAMRDITVGGYGLSDFMAYGDALPGADNNLGRDALWKAANQAIQEGRLAFAEKIIEQMDWMAGHVDDSSLYEGMSESFKQRFPQAEDPHKGLRQYLNLRKLQLEQEQEHEQELAAYRMEQAKLRDAGLEQIREIERSIIAGWVERFDQTLANMRQSEAEAVAFKADHKIGELVQASEDFLIQQAALYGDEADRIKAAKLDIQRSYEQRIEAIQQGLQANAEHMTEAAREQAEAMIQRLRLDMQTTQRAAAAQIGGDVPALRDHGPRFSGEIASARLGNRYLGLAQRQTAAEAATVKTEAHVAKLVRKQDETREAIKMMAELFRQGQRMPGLFVRSY